MIKNVILITIILNSLVIIPIPEAHGYGFILFIDVLSVTTLFKKIAFDQNLILEPTLIIVGFFSIFGKIGLISSLFISKQKHVMRIISLTLLFVSWVILFYCTWDFDFLTLLTLIVSIPFLVYLSRLSYLIIKGK